MTRPFAVVDVRTGRVISRHSTEQLAEIALIRRMKSTSRRLNFNGSQGGVSADRFVELGIERLA